MTNAHPVYFLPSQQTSMSPGAYTNPATGREFQAACNDQYGETFTCPAPLSWAATSGSFTPSPFHSGPDYTYWLSSGTTSSVTVTASSSMCGSASTPYQMPVCSSVSLNPIRVPLATPSPDPTKTNPVPSENLNFSLRCYDQYSEQFVCTAAPVWSNQSGFFTESYHDVPTDTYVQYWNATSVYGPYDFTASVFGCGTGQWQYRPPAVCANLSLSYGLGTTEDFALSPGYTSSGSKFIWSPNGLENYMQALPGKFWGYNWTNEWLNRPTPDWVPMRTFGATCADQYNQSIACSRLNWTTNVGTFDLNDSGRLLPGQYALPNMVTWFSANASSPVNITAVASYCAVSNLSFDLYVHNACRVIPDPALTVDVCALYPWLRSDPDLQPICNFPVMNLSNQGSGNFTALCRDDVGQWLNCLEPDFVIVRPQNIGNATSTQYWQSFRLINDTFVTSWAPSFMGNRVVTFNASRNDTFGILGSGGPTHYCNAGILIGNPAFGCNLTASNETPQVGQTVQVSASCFGLYGAAPCPRLQFNASPALSVNRTSNTSADVTGLLAGVHDFSLQLPNGGGPKSNSSGPDSPLVGFSCNMSLNVTPAPCRILPTRARFSGQTTDFASVLQSVGHLEAVPDMVLDNADLNVSYLSPVFACGQDFDGNIRTASGFLAVDSERFDPTFSHPGQPVTIVMKNIPGTEVPPLMVVDGFANSPADVFQFGQDCVAASRCKNVLFDPTAHTLTFQTTGFSSFAAGGDNSIKESLFLPPAVRFLLDCPLPELGQNLTKASAFLYVNGTPATNQTMALEYTLNSTFAFETQPIFVDPETGRHDFILDTRYDGRYRIAAQSGNLTSNDCRVDVFQTQSTQLPDIHPGILVLVFLSAAVLVRRRNNRR